MGASDLDARAFDALGEVARQGVRRVIRDLLLSPIVPNTSDGQGAVVLGGLSGAVECFVCAAREGTTSDEIKNALCQVVRDYVDQAKDRLKAGMQ